MAKKFEIEIVGTKPLLMHNSKLSNPLDPTARKLKVLTAKRKKTDGDHEEMARIEFMGGLYIDDVAGPYVPGDNVWRALYDAAKKTNSGPKVKEGLLIESDINPILYKGPRDVEALYADANFWLTHSAKIGIKRVMRTRPKFLEWSLTADGTYDENILNFAEIQGFAATAGQLIGLGDWRPRYGQFKATVREI